MKGERIETRRMDEKEDRLREKNLEKTIKILLYVMQKIQKCKNIIILFLKYSTVMIHRIPYNRARTQQTKQNELSSYNRAIFHLFSADLGRSPVLQTPRKLKNGHR